ncbi:MAG: CRISPR-associated protein Cas4 [Desulfurococcales archaeon]|nr:CRISPR-associated protein Cas4 [Desulfurococcales archaeon]
MGSGARPRYYEGTLTPTDLKDYAYCPVIPWLRLHASLREAPTPSMEAGRLDAGEKLAIAGRLGLPRPHRVEVPLESRRLGLRGVVDIVAGRGPYTVVEVKALPRSPRRAGHFRLQLLAYVLLVLDSMGPVGRAILYLAGRPVEVPVNERTLGEALAALARLRRLLASEEPPLANQPGAKCLYCGYRRSCPRASV